MVSHYRELVVWQKAMDLADAVYDAAAFFPKEEKYELVSQIKRSAISVPSNIAEGFGRRNRKEFAQFLRISKGSLLELETQILLSSRRKFIHAERLQTLLALSAEVGKMLLALQRSLQKPASPALTTNYELRTTN